MVAKSKKSAKSNGKAKKAKKEKAPARTFRVDTGHVEKLTKEISGLKGLISSAGVGATGAGVSTSLRAQRRVVTSALRSLVAAARAQVKNVRKLRDANFK